MSTFGTSLAFDFHLVVTRILKMLIPAVRLHPDIDTTNTCTTLEIGKEMLRVSGIRMILTSYADNSDNRNLTNLGYVFSKLERVIFIYCVFAEQPL